MIRARRLWLAAAAAVLAGGWLQAQGAAPPPAQDAVVIKGKAPVSTDVLKVTLPRPQEADLANGIHLMVLEDRRAPQVSLQLIIPGAGGYYDPADLPGLAQFTAAQMREGTATRTSEQIATELERIAATLNAGAGMSSQEATVFAACLSDHFESVLGLMADMLLRPSFRDEELARYKTQQRAQLMQVRANPSFLAAERFNQVVFGAHPASRVVPAPASLDAVTRERLAAFHRARYVPDHAILAVAGDVTMARVRAGVESALAGWARANTPKLSLEDPAPVASAGRYLVVRPNSVQTDLVVGTQSIRRTDADFFRLTVLNKVIGGGPTGRLFIHLREQKGYTYGAYSALGAGPYRGAWQASTQVRTDVTGPALTDLLDEIRQMRDVAVPAKEFADQKRSIVASFALTLESADAVLGNHITRYRYGLPLDYWDQYPARIMAVTQAEVQEAAKKYLDPARLQIVAVGDAEKVGAVLRALGPVDTYDADGRKLP